jgi:hypothetical protein
MLPRHPSGRSGRSTNTVSDWLNSRAIACICASVRSSASGTIDTGLPVSGTLAKTSTNANRTVDPRRVISRYSVPRGGLGGQVRRCYQ